MNFENFNQTQDEQDFNASFSAQYKNSHQNNRSKSKANQHYFKEKGDKAHRGPIKTDNQTLKD
jgi:hypothetical protein